MGYVWAGVIFAVLLAVILWSGRNDFGDSVWENTRRSLYVIAGIAVVFSAIVWVSTYGN